MMHSNYRTDHRNEWKKMGFHTMSVVVPIEEKEIVLAESAIRRATHALELLDLVASGSSTNELMRKVRWLANRNRMGDITKEQMDALRARLGYKAKADMLAKLLKKAKDAREKCVEHGHKFALMKDDEADEVAVEAGYMVAYSWLSNGYLKLVEAYVNHAEREVGIN